jgi:hypothetical protein
MHYKNGRPAKDGDPVVGETYKGSGRMMAGILHSTSSNPNCTSCNGQVCMPITGGVTNMCVTIGDLYHAEDVFRAAESNGVPAMPV